MTNGRKNLIWILNRRCAITDICKELIISLGQWRFLLEVSLQNHFLVGIYGSFGVVGVIAGLIAAGLVG